MKQRKLRIIEGTVVCNHDGSNVIPFKSRRSDLDTVLLIHFEDKKVRVTIEEMTPSSVQPLYASGR